MTTTSVATPPRSASGTARAARLDRMGHANAVLKTLSDHGRRFFYNAKHDRVARFELDGRGALWFIDDYLDSRVYVAYAGRWRGFSHGGTMRSLVESLRDYVRTGEAIHPGHFGPWHPELVGGGDLWGYGHATMTTVRADLQGNPAVRSWPDANATPVAA